MGILVECVFNATVYETKGQAKQQFIGIHFNQIKDSNQQRYHELQVEVARRFRTGETFKQFTA